MRKIFGFALALCMMAPYVRAQDTENSDKATTDVSKNPITGTKTTTHKRKIKRKEANGKSDTVEVTEKTKEKKKQTCLELA